MGLSRRQFLLTTSAIVTMKVLGRESQATAAPSFGILEINEPMAPPDWALRQREVLDAHTAACEAFFDRYYDERGFLECVTRWGGDDGPDDAIENVNDWPHLYALGGAERIRQMYEKAYEGHVRQYGQAHTTDVEFARHGMYFRDFPVMMDWQHNGEGLTVFNLMGLGNPYSKSWRDRVRRFAGFYIGEDPSAPNYDPKLKLIRSMFNGSRGPLLRKTTGLDWAGDPIDLTGTAQASLLHGENSYSQMVEHFKDYNDIVGDNPLNLNSTSLAFNAYALSHEPKYKAWILEYVDAWIDRARHNSDILPSNIGLDGSVGGGAEGKWYGGVYGWNFSPVVPMTGKRQDRNRVPYCLFAFFNAYVLTGDDRYLDVWRRMTDRINANAKMIDGKMSSPHMYGDQGWYSFQPGKWVFGTQDIYIMSMKPSDRARAPDHPWLLFLEGKNPGYPESILNRALAHIRQCGEAIRADTTSPDTRFADTVMDQNPASIEGLAQLMEGALYVQHPGWSTISPAAGGTPLYARLRYFDPVGNRAGVPKGVAALVESMSGDSTVVSLVNVDPTESRTVTLQGGAYGEHQILSVTSGKQSRPVNNRFFSVRLAPGAGTRLTLAMKRYANQPTLEFPWEGPPVDQTPPQTEDPGSY